MHHRLPLPPKRVLFLCHKNSTYGFNEGYSKRSGLHNSTRFIVEALNEHPHAFHAKLVDVTDNNSIDKEVHDFKPSVVVIEALWVVPEKFDILKKLHPQVRWFVHLHSNIPWLAIEGIAMEWLVGYAQREVGIIANSVPAYRALRVLLDRSELTFLPNVYLGHPKPFKKHRRPFHLDVACFGAVRPLKNQLIQAMAAIKLAKQQQKILYFHINGTRVETNGDPVLKNLRALFKNTSDAFLIEHPWMKPDALLKHLRSMDLSMQVSLSETFCVVAADSITAGVPVVVSKEISWVSKLCQAQDDSVDSIACAMKRVLHNTWLVRLNQFFLKRYSLKSQRKWIKFISEA